MADQPMEWTVQVRDRARRVRDLKVYVAEDNQVVIQAPPGEVGILDAQGLAALRQALLGAESVTQIRQRP